MALMVSISGVRGIVGPELDPRVIGRWVQALASVLPGGPVVVGRDPRPSGAALSAAACAYFASAGRAVFDVGIVPTPTVQLAVEAWGAAGGVILSASHNPPAWNAMKFVDTDGSFLSANRFEELRAAALSERAIFASAEHYGTLQDRNGDALSLHEQCVLDMVDVARIRHAKMRVRLECGHGAGGVLLPRIAEALGVDLDLRHGDPTGQLLPDPEPTGHALQSLIADGGAGVDFAVMVDPDADRCGFALPGTRFVGEEWTLPLVISHRLDQATGPVVTNLSTSTLLDVTAERHGVSVIRTPVGEAHVVSEMRRVSALIGGEGNGGVIDPRCHLGRDSAVALALLCEAHATIPGGLRERAQSFPERVMLKEKIILSDKGFDALAPILERDLGVPDDRRDGLRWSAPDGFAHVRASNTEPVVRAVVESATEVEARAWLTRIRSSLT